MGYWFFPITHDQLPMTCFLWGYGAGTGIIPAPSLRGASLMRTAYFIKTDGRYRVSCGKTKRSATHRIREMRKG